jgi:acyl-CoA hydrolase
MDHVDTEHYTEQHKSLAMTVLMTPDMANFAGYVHGGATLKLLDQVAYACASRYSGRYVITVSVDQVVFREPTHVGELVTFLASVNYTGKSSMEVGVRVVAEDIRSRTERHVMTCYFTMVAVDDNRKPCTVPSLRVETPTELRRWKAARLRRLLRQEIAERNLEIRLHPDDLEQPSENTA